MNSYTDDTFEVKWMFTGSDGEYSVVYSILTETFYLFRSSDVEEVTYRNCAVKKDHKPLTGEFHDIYNHHSFAIALNNTLHCDTSYAACVPCGLEVFQPHTDVKHYIIHGKIMSQYSWLTWVKNTSSWPTVMANILGSKNPE